MSTSSAPLYFVASSGLLSAISGHFLSLITSGGPLSIVINCLSSSVASGYPLSIVSGRLSSPITSGGPLSAISNSGSLFLVPPASSWALFLTSTPSHTYRSSLSSLLLFYISLPSLPIPLAPNPTPLTGKRLFDQAFIIQRPVDYIRSQEKLDLSFE